MAVVYARFMVVFFFLVSVPDIIRPLTDAPSGGLLLWPEAAQVFGIFLANWLHFVIHWGLGFVGLFLMWRTDTAREYARLNLVVLLFFLGFGLTTDGGVWIVPATWPADVSSGTIAPLAHASWYGYIPLNWPDNFLHIGLALISIVVALTPVGLREWGYWPNRRSDRR